MTQTAPQPENLAKLVFLIRGEKVLLDTDLADLYGVEARALNQSVALNRNRFPDDFMFQLTAEEWTAMRSQIVTTSALKGGKSSQTVTSTLTVAGLTSQIVMSNVRGGRRTLPYAFTEEGVAMLSSVLRSQRAVEVNIAIMRTFVQLRRLMDSNRDLARRIARLGLGAGGFAAGDVTEPDAALTVMLIGPWLGHASWHAYKGSVRLL